MTNNKEYMRQWKLAHADQVRAYNKYWRTIRKLNGKQKLYDQEYRRKNSIKINARHRTWKTTWKLLHREEYLTQHRREEAKRKAKMTKEEKYKEQRKAALKKLYRLSLDDYMQMYKHQNGLCAICKKESKRKNKLLCVDHDHTTGIVRGLLCDICNSFLGRINDDSRNLKKVKHYLTLTENTTMPIKKVTVNGGPAWQWGTKGKKYPYKTGDKAASLRAKKRAIAQGIAVAKSQGTKPAL